MDRKWLNPRNAEQYQDFCSSSRLYHNAAIELARLASSTPPKYALDLCCGTGVSSSTIADIFPETLVVGIDPSSAQIEEAARSNGRKNVTYLHGDVSDLPMGHKFDAVFCNAAIWYLHLPSTLDRLSSSLTSDASFYYNCPPSLSPRHLSVLPSNAPFAGIHDSIRSLHSSTHRRRSCPSLTHRSTQADLVMSAKNFRTVRVEALDHVCDANEHLLWLEIPVFWHTYFPHIGTREKLQLLSQLRSSNLDLRMKKVYLAMLSFHWKKVERPDRP